MRATLILFLLAAACSYDESNSPVVMGYGGGSDDGGAGGAAGECIIDSDCVAAGARCCDCPTYAMPVDPDNDICAGVTCPMPGPSCAQNLHAACVQNECELACDVVECDQQCSDGFAIDANGCATCSCFAVTDRTCTLSSDCAEVPADCCGCAFGGSDTAVPTGDVESFEAGLDCPTSPSCPGVNTCEADQEPACVQGGCALEQPLPANACGRPDLPLCGAGTICALNSDPAATAQGVGTCIPAT